MLPNSAIPGFLSNPTLRSGSIINSLRAGLLSSNMRIRSAHKKKSLVLPVTTCGSSEIWIENYTLQAIGYDIISLLLILVIEI